MVKGIDKQEVESKQVVAERVPVRETSREKALRACRIIIPAKGARAPNLWREQTTAHGRSLSRSREEKRSDLGEKSRTCRNQTKVLGFKISGER